MSSFSSSVSTKVVSTPMDGNATRLFSTAIGNLSKVLDDLKSAKDMHKFQYHQLKEKDQIIVKLEKGNIEKDKAYQVLLESHEGSFGKWDAEKDDLNKIILTEKKSLQRSEQQRKGLEEELGRSRAEAETNKKLASSIDIKREHWEKYAKNLMVTIAELEKKNEQGALHAKKLSNDLEIANKEKIQLSQALISMEGKNKKLVSEWDQYWSVLHDTEKDDLNRTLKEELFAFWIRTRSLIEEYFLVEIPEHILQERMAWTKLTEAIRLGTDIPLPQSNSPAAQRMRVAVVLALVAEHMKHHILVPIYTQEADSQVEELLLRVAEGDNEHESACRGMLLLASGADQERYAEEQATAFADRILDTVHVLLRHHDSSELRAKLVTLAQDMTKSWQNAQRSLYKYEACVQLESPYHTDWETVDLSKQTGNCPKSEFQKCIDPLLVLFPAVSIIYMREDWESCWGGVALDRSQTKEAKQECRKSFMSRKTGKEKTSSSRQLIAKSRLSWPFGGAQ